MALKVVNATPLGETPYDQEVMQRIGAEYVLKYCPTEDDLIATAGDADAVITVMEPFTARVIENLKSCKVIAVSAIGYDLVDVPTATKRGICVCNAPEYCLDEMSDHAMALLLACARRIVSRNKYIKAADTDHMPGGPVSKLRGQTLGLVGFGRIPRTLVRKAQGFGLKVIAHDPYVSRATVIGYDVELVPTLDALLERADFVSVHAALVPENRHMFGLEQFKRMKPTAYFINTARGGLVDEDALYTALNEGHIAGAGLDVTEPEMNFESPLLTLDNLIYTGHFGFYSDTSIAELRRFPIDEVERVLGLGQWPYGLVNPQVKPAFAERWGKTLV